MPNPKGVEVLVKKIDVIDGKGDDDEKKEFMVRRIVAELLACREAQKPLNGALDPDVHYIAKTIVAFWDGERSLYTVQEYVSPNLDLQ